MRSGRRGFPPPPDGAKSKGPAQGTQSPSHCAGQGDRDTAASLGPAGLLRDSFWGPFTWHADRRMSSAHVERGAHRVTARPAQLGVQPPKAWTGHHGAGGCPPKRSRGVVLWRVRRVPGPAPALSHTQWPSPSRRLLRVHYCGRATDGDAEARDGQEDRPRPPRQNPLCLSQVPCSLCGWRPEILLHALARKAAPLMWPGEGTEGFLEERVFLLLFFKFPLPTVSSEGLGTGRKWSMGAHEAPPSTVADGQGEVCFYGVRMR